MACGRCLAQSTELVGPYGLITCNGSYSTVPFFDLCDGCHRMHESSQHLFRATIRERGPRQKKRKRRALHTGQQILATSALITNKSSLRLHCSVDWHSVQSLTVGLPS